jgi:hypothetical protein
MNFFCPILIKVIKKSMTMIVLKDILENGIEKNTRRSESNTGNKKSNNQAKKSY